jgi:hypothetical protein
VSSPRKPVFAAVLGLVLVVAAACGGSSATPTPAAASVAPGGSTAPSSSAAANGNDASSLIAQALSGGSNVKSFHIKFAVSGTISAAAMAAESDDPTAQALTLDGTGLEGDVDLANGAGHIAVNIPAIAALGGVPITADVIVVDGSIYVQTALLGSTKYMVLNADSLSGLTGMVPLPSLPVSIPSADANASSALSQVTDQLAQLQQQLDAAGAKATIVGTEQIGGQDATHVNVTVPVDWINAQITSAEASSTDTPPPGLEGAKLDSSTFDLWVYKSNNQLAQLHFTAASSVVGNIDVMLTLTNYDQPVTISAPPASEISSANPFSGLLP